MSLEKWLLEYLLFSYSCVQHPPTLTACSERIRWNVFTETALQEGVAPLLFAYYRDNEPCLFPDDVARIFRQAFQETRVRNIVLIGEARRACRALEEDAIPTILLKGIHLAETIYPHPATRGSGDVDILIQPENLAAAERCLGRSGYVAVDARPETARHNPLGYLSSVEFRRHNVPGPPLHVHWHLVNSSAPAHVVAQTIDMNRVWAQATRCNIAGYPFRVLCPEHLLLYLCEHALRVGHTFDRLILLCDIQLFINGSQLDWNRVIEEGQKMGLNRFLFMATSIVSYYAPISIPEETRKILSRLHRPRLLETFLLRQFQHRRRVTGGGFLIYLSMTPGWIGKIQILFRAVFPPSPILRQRRYLLEASFYSNVCAYAHRLAEIGAALLDGWKSALRREKA